MALKVGNEWKEHGWWIQVDASQKPMLWITSYMVVEGRHWSAVGKSFGEISTISASGSTDVLVTVSADESSPSKIRLQRRLLFAPIPRIFLEGAVLVRGVRPLQEFWLTMPEEVRSAREIAVQRFIALNPEEVMRATELHLQHSAYDDIRSRDASISHEQRPSEPEETDPIYRVVAAPVIANWDIPRSRAPRPRPTEPTTEEALQSTAGEGVIERSVRRRIAGGLQSTSSERTHSGPRSTPTGSTPRASIVVRAPGVAHPSRGTVAQTGTSVGAHHAESSRAGALRSSSRQSPVDVPRATVPQRTSAHVDGVASTRQGPQTSGRTEGRGAASQGRQRRGGGRRTQPRTERALQAEGGIEDEAEDIDEPSDEEERTATGWRRIPRASHVKFPTEEELQKGYIWGTSFQFDATFDNIRPVQNVETNHRCISQRRVREMYKRLGGPDASLVSPLTLRPIAYLVDERNEENETRYREVPFGREDPIRQFESAFLQHGRLVPGDAERSRMLWLQNRIVWEPVDGQHIVAACHLAKEDFIQGRMTEEVYNRSYAKHKARVIVFNKPQVYIEASVRINAKEFERDFYTTLYEDMVSLRSIWVSCGRPNPEIRADDARRKDAVTMAASALHMTVSCVGKSFTLGSLYKRMLEYTRHAWHEDEACYRAALQVCTDYEDGTLWYSAADYKRWLHHATKHQLDPSIDTRPNRRRMYVLWLRPLSRVPKKQYLKLAKKMAARPIEEGTRPRQNYFFDQAASLTPKKKTLAWVVDRIQRREAIRNAFRWLTVRQEGLDPQSMTEFFAINVDRFAGPGQKQLQLFGAAVEKKMQIAWAAPAVKSVAMLERVQHLITPMVKAHFNDIVAGGRGYRGYRRNVANIAGASWDWQVDVPCPTGGSGDGRLPIRCRGSVFQGDGVQIGEPCLWMFDCRRGTTGGEDVCWTEVEYGNVIQQVKKWMEGIHRWNAVFLLPAGVFFDDSMRTRFGLVAECTVLRGCWIFDATTVATSGQDLKNGGQVEQSVQAIGGVAILMEHPTGSRAVENIVRNAGGQLPLAFTDSWNAERMPRAADTLERTSTELQRMVRAYLPPSWCLVAVGITTSIVDIVQDGFQGSQVIVVDCSPVRTRYLYNTLESVYTADMHILRHVPVDQSTVPSSGEEPGRAERRRKHVQERSSEEDMQDQVTGEAERNDVEQSEEEMEDDGTGAAVEIRMPRDETTEPEDDDTSEEDTSEEDTSEDQGSSEEDDNGDGEEPSGITLNSKSTNRSGGASTDTEDEDYLPNRSSGRRQSSDEPATSTEGQGQEQEHDSTEGGDGHERGNRTVEMIMEEVFGAGEEEPWGSPGSNTVHLSQPRTEHMDVDVQARVESGAEGLLVLRTEGETPVPTIAEERHLEVLGHTAATTGTDSDSLSFQWAMEGSGYTERGDGYYYDVDGVRYRRSGEDGQYTYEQVASVLEGTVDDDRVPSPTVDAMVSQAIDYASPDAPPRVPTPPELQSLYACKSPPHEGHDEASTQSSQAAAPAP